MTDTPLRIIAFGAHPDDCELFCGGLAAKWTAQGHAVKFVSLTNGNAGHHLDDRETLRRRRAREAKAAAAVLGIECDVLDINDGELTPSLDAREEVLRLIRQWGADCVFSHRPNDYHPDHRAAGLIVQDTAYLVMVPLVCPEVPALRKNPCFFYFWDRFTKPNAFRPDAVAAVDEVMETKWALLHAHESQFYEWLPYVEGTPEPVPFDEASRPDWLRRVWAPWLKGVTADCAEAVARRYGASAASIEFVEAFELCEYGRQPGAEEMERIFPR